MSNSFSKRKLLIDSRWSGNHGIGRYSRELIPRISDLSDGILCSGNPLGPGGISLGSLFGRGFSTFYSPGYAPLIGVNTQIITMHDLILLQPEIVKKPQYLFFNRFILPRIKSGNLKVITVSSASQDQIASWARIDLSEIPIVPNGLSQEIIDEGKSFSANRERQSLIFVGNLKKHKNFNLFVQTVNLLPGSWKIVLVGPGLNSRDIAERHEVETYWNISDRDLAMLYNKTSLLVNTSNFEGFGMPFLEAGYLGCQVVHLGVLPTVTDILGEDSFHTRGSSCPHDLADLIFEVSKKTYEPRIRRFLSEKFSWTKSAEILRNELTKV